MPVLALDPRVGHVRQRQMRQSIRQNRRPVARNVGVVEKQKDQRRAQKYQPWHRIQKVRHRVEIAKPLRKPQPRRKQRIIRAQNLDHPSCPPNPLPHMRRQPLSRQSRRLRNVDVRRRPAIHLHPQRRVRVLRHRLHRDAARIVQRRTPQHRARPAEKRRVPEVVPVLHHTVEQLALIRNNVKLPQVPLKRIGRIKMMRRLQHPQLLVAKKPAHRHL